MNVKQLKEFLENIPDDTIVMTLTEDRRYLKEANYIDTGTCSYYRGHGVYNESCAPLTSNRMINYLTVE